MIVDRLQVNLFCLMIDKRKSDNDQARQSIIFFCLTHQKKRIDLSIG